MILQFSAEKALTALPLRAFLRKKGVSQSLWRRLKHNGIVTVNGVSVNLTQTIINPADEIILNLPERTKIIPVDLPIEICYEDENLLIVNKPVNQLVHPVGKDFDNTLGNAVMNYYQGRGLPITFHPLHRLDRNTTGLVLIAKQPNIQHILTTGAKKLFKRQYLSIIRGVLSPPKGVIDAPLSRKPGSLIEQEVASLGKKAVTCYHTIDISPDKHFSLIELALETGRTHQIRVHLSYLGHPLLGDDLYGGNHELINRPALHAYKMEITHPLTNKLLMVMASLPGDFQELLEKLRLTCPTR